MDDPKKHNIAPGKSTELATEVSHVQHVHAKRCMPGLGGVVARAKGPMMRVGIGKGGSPRTEQSAPETASASGWPIGKGPNCMSGKVWPMLMRSAQIRCNISAARMTAASFRRHASRPKQTSHCGPHEFLAECQRQTCIHARHSHQPVVHAASRQTTLPIRHFGHDLPCRR